MNMNIQADINWIKTELDKVQDPYLIEAFINLLKYRNRSVEKEMDRMILEGEEDIKNGNVIPHANLKEEMKSWRK